MRMPRSFIEGEGFEWNFPDLVCATPFRMLVMNKARRSDDAEFNWSLRDLRPLIDYSTPAGAQRYDLGDECWILDLPEGRHEPDTASRQVPIQQSRRATATIEPSQYNRRVAIYDALMKLISIAIQKGDTSDAERRECEVAMKDVAFLFDEEVSKYSQNILKQAVTLHIKKIYST
jgi:hypothetical protein